MRRVISAAWTLGEPLSEGSSGQTAEAVTQAMELLDQGVLRVAEPAEDRWIVHEWLMRAVMMAAKINRFRRVQGAPDGAVWWDKDPVKFEGWDEQDFRDARFRLLAGAMVRHSAFIEKDAVIMPCFISWGARIGTNSSIDSFATVGSCAQIGANVHISAGVTIGGVFEPMQERPVIIEDDAFVGANSSITEGVHVGRGAVVSSGVHLTGSTKIFDRVSGVAHVGYVPAGSVVVGGFMPSTFADGTPGPATACGVIVKQATPATYRKTAITDLLRV